MAFIYKITNDINQRIYIGMTERSIEERFKEHCRAYKQEKCEKRPLYSAMKKYGPEHFHVELVEETDNPEEREQYWIEFYNSYKEGYNATLGGDGRSHINQDEIEKILEAYNRLGTVVAVKQETGHDVSCISRLLKQAGVQVITSQEISRKKLSKSITQYTKDTHEALRTFNSTADAAQWCYENKKCPILCSGVRGHIAEVANGKRKSAYGYVWKYN